MVGLLRKRALLITHLPTVSVTEHQLPADEEIGPPQAYPGRNMPGHASACVQGGPGAANGAGLLREATYRFPSEHH